MKVEIPSNAFVSIYENFIIKTFGALTNMVKKTPEHGLKTCFEMFGK
jgi:hypothetical protein